MNILDFTTKKYRIVIAFAVAGIFFGFFYSKKKPILYESNLTFSLDEGSNGAASGGFASIMNQFGIGAGDNNDLFSGDNIIEVIKSKRIIEDVLLEVDTFNHKPMTMAEYLISINFSHQTELVNKTKASGNFFPIGINKLELTYDQKNILSDIYSKIVNEYLVATRPDKKLNIYAIKFRSTDEHFTKLFTDKILASTLKFYTELKVKKSKETMEVLEQRVSDIRNQLGATISERAKIQDANINPVFAKSQIAVQQQQMNIQSYKGAYEELCKNLELARFQYLQKIPLLQVIDQADYPMDKIEANKFKYMLIGSVIFSILSICILLIYASIKRKIA